MQSDRITLIEISLKLSIKIVTIHLIHNQIEFASVKSDCQPFVLPTLRQAPLGELVATPELPHP